MLGKGVVRLILIAMLVVCLIQFFFYLPTRSVEKKAESFALENTAHLDGNIDKDSEVRRLRSRYLDSISGETVLSLPLLKDYTYTDLKKQQLALGLDLKGGMSTILQVNLRDMINSLAGTATNMNIRTALDNADVRLASNEADYITLFAEEYRKISGDNQLATVFSKSPTLRDEINLQTPDREVISKLRTLADETVDLTYNRIKDRIDKFGVVQPNISLDKARDMIVVELPGVDNPERARTYLQASAKLEFWEVYRVTDPGVIDAFVAADQKLKQMAAGDSSAVVQDSFTLQERYSYTRDSLGVVIDSVLEGVDTIMANQDSEIGPLFKILSVNANGGASAIMGTVEKNQRNHLMSMLSDPAIKPLFPKNLDFRLSYKPINDYETNETTSLYELYALRKKQGSTNAPLDGERITRASANPDPVSGQVAVSLTMDNRGGKIWGDMTTKAAQDNNREIAITLDDEVVSCPRVNEPILGGSSQISGNFTIDEAKDLANILQVGKLPAKTQIVQESLVGPSLGKENIKKSLYAIIGGFLLVMLFMLLYYLGGGIVSIIALLLNVIFILGTLASMGYVLTLPGIAGLVLTIGMAVDANVIIYERIKEELTSGRSLFQGMVEGFKHSYSAIVDANITTLLTALVLAYFGIGPIKGFAVVLIIGIIFSFFTAVFVSRVILEWWIGKKGRNISFYSSFTARAFKDLNIDWVSLRKYSYVLSGIFITIAIISFVTRGFEFGVEFKGGYSMNIEFEEGSTVTADELREGLASYLDGTPVVKVIDNDRTFNVTTSYLINNLEQGTEGRVADKIIEGVQSITGKTYDREQFISPEGTGTHIKTLNKVGPVIADDIRKSAVYSLVIALILIFLYILFRFSKWQYSAGATAALIHDVLFTLGLFSLLHGVVNFSMEIDQAFIAALLTIIGYSMNDTVIVFDRIREYLGLKSDKSDKEVINDAINSTLSRTVNTSLATLLTVVVLFLFGGSSIKGFAFALMIGVMIGTYSSVFIATPVVVDFTKNLRTKKQERVAARRARALKGIMTA